MTLLIDTHNRIAHITGTVDQNGFITYNNIKFDGIFAFARSTCSKELSNPEIHESIYLNDGLTEISFLRATKKISKYFEDIWHLTSQQKLQKMHEYFSHGIEKFYTEMRRKKNEQKKSDDCIIDEDILDEIENICVTLENVEIDMSDELRKQAVNKLVGGIKILSQSDNEKKNDVSLLENFINKEKDNWSFNEKLSVMNNIMDIVKNLLD